MKIISMVNNKGGVGKSTIAANFGSILALRGKRVLLVDLDPQANLTFLFIKPDIWQSKYKENKTIKNWFSETLNNRKTADIKRYITKDIDANKIIRNSGGCDISIIPSHNDLGMIQQDLAICSNGRNEKTKAKNYINSISKLSISIEALSDNYDYVILDCQPSYDLITQSAIYASNAYIIPVKLEYLSVLGIPTLIEHISSSKRKINDDIRKYNLNNYHLLNAKMLGVLPNMIKRFNNNISSHDSQYKFQIERNNIKVFNCGIREARVDLDRNTKLPFILANSSKKKSDLYNDFEKCIDECLKEL